MSQIVPVWMWLPDQIEPVLAGEFGWSKSGGEFSYDGSYIQNHRGMALDPIELPTRIGAFRATGPDRVFGVLRDCGPDSWGEYLLQRRIGELTPLQRLTECSTDGSGSIAVGDLKPGRYHSTWTLERLMDVGSAWATDDRDDAQPGFDEFLTATAPPTSLGGTKPKLELDHDSRLWLVKFPDRGDPADFAAVEAAALTLARLCGIETPDHRVIKLGSGDRTIRGLMIDRFDRHRVHDGYARHGYASAHTVLRLRTGAEGPEMRSYNAFSHELARWCARGGSKDLGALQQRELWRRVVFNGLISNYDDHARNHALIRIGEQWQLSPIFDVVAFRHGAPRRTVHMPYLRGTQDGNVITPSNLLKAAGQYKWTQQEAKAELEFMGSIVAKNWLRVMRDHGCSERTIEARSSAFGLAYEIFGLAAASPTAREEMRG